MTAPEKGGQGTGEKCLRVHLESFDKINMMDPRLTLSNRPENLKPLMNYVRKWVEDRGLSPNRRRSLEKAVEEIFRHLVTYAYQPDQPGSIAISLEERGPRLRLMFEDDAAPHNPSSLPAPDGSALIGCCLDNGLQQLAESMVYYRTADRKNRVIVFLT
jgi:anti-sigma regulatory factor (Ser/Thr protein kinase)